MVKVTIIITEAPYGKENAFGFLAAAGAIATIHDTSVIFAEAGVLNSVKNQDTSNFIELNKKFLGLPSNEKKITEYQEIDINFFAHGEAIEKRGINSNDIIEGVKIISIDQITDKILESNQILIV